MQSHGSPLNRFSRRDWLHWTSGGLAGAALAALLGSGRDLRAAESPPAAKTAVAPEASDPPPHHPPRARRAIHICLCGGFSHIDTFDYKPELERLHGKSLTSSEKPDVFFGKVGLLRKNDWAFKQRGKSGLWISELFPNLAELADELTVIRSMVAESSSHTPATFQENSGFRLNGFPTLGSWLSYGLGNETDDLPTFVVLPDARGYPAGGTNNWTNGFLPPRHQGVAFRTKGAPIPDLVPGRTLTAQLEADSRQLLGQLNRLNLVDRGGDQELAGRIRSYELAAKMQLAVPRVTNLEAETAATQQAYGLHQPETAEFGRACLLSRRLLEQGVRFVQVFSGGDFSSPRINWDAHENVVQNHSQEAQRIDQPVAALLRDLRSRGMLDDTLVLFTSEFGRTPFTQSDSNSVGLGRDHNQTGFSVWMAGAGLKPGIAHGATDDLGWKAAENPVSWYDFHATVLHLLGVDHQRLTYYHNGIQRRLTNVHGHVVEPILS
ncbi:MAG: DUF1501 domain-containing protein [Planctomycetota bacterium]